MDAMGGGLNRKETSVTSDNVDSALDFLVRLDLGVLISRGSKRCKKHRNFPAAHEEDKGVRNRKTTFLHKCTRTRFLTPYLPLVTRRSYGFRTPEVAKLALLHNLRRLPEPESTHRFC
jgi:hypothetical protein